MNPERLDQLIAAYGAEPARWPAVERAEAEALLGADAAALHAARALDEALDAWRPQFPTMDLRNRILAAAPKPRGQGLVRGWARPRLWLRGAGLAIACAAGVAVGATLIGPNLANVFPSERGEAESAMTDGLSAFGSPLETGTPG
jgi:hypothetical protein